MTNRDLARLLADRQEPLHPHYGYRREPLDYSVRGCDGTTLYARSLTTDSWATSVDGETFTDHAAPMSTHPGVAPVEVVRHADYLLAVTLDGRLFRAVAGVYDAWVDVSPPAPAQTTGRQSVIASDGTSLCYGNYNGSDGEGAHVYRSADNGDTWTEVLTVPEARHVHAVVHDGNVWWATIGDDVLSGGGLYRSGDGQSWSRVSSNRYGIDIVPVPASGGVARRLLLEGDGTAEAHVFAFWPDDVDTTTDAVVWPDESWNGSARAAVLTADGNLLYATIGEAGAIGTRNGLWIAKGPWFARPLLLEEFSPDMLPSWLKTFELGGYLFNGRWRMTTPKFRSQS